MTEGDRERLLTFGPVASIRLWKAIRAISRPESEQQRVWEHTRGYR